jgi:hypothetical protein
MVLPILSHILSIPHQEAVTRNALFSEAITGKQFRRAVHASSRLFIERTTIQFPNKSGQTFADLVSFWNGVSGPVLPWLIKARLVENYMIQDEDAGTSLGGGSEIFYFTRRYVDASTLVVKVDDVTQTLTTDYSLVGNTLEEGAEPSILTTATFDTGSVTFDYEYYHRVRFDVEDLSAEIQVPSESLTEQGTKNVVVSMSEVVPGDSFQ